MKDQKMKNTAVDMKELERVAAFGGNDEGGAVEPTIAISTIVSIVSAATTILTCSYTCRFGKC